MKYVFLILALVYALVPYDLIPDVPGLGWLDDIAIVGLALRYFFKQKRKTQTGKQYYQQYRKAAGQDRDGPGPNRPGGEDDAGNRQKTDSSDPYGKLGVERGASLEEVKKAYRELVNKYHPDKVSHLGDEFKEMAERRFKEIQEAYQTIQQSRK